MPTVAKEYDGKHRPDYLDDQFDADAFGSAISKVASAIRGVPDESPRHARPIFDITEGDWRFIAEDTEDAGTARIRVLRNGEQVRWGHWPTYKVWNVAAHVTDWIATFEAELEDEPC